MVTDIHAKFHKQQFTMRRAIKLFPSKHSPSGPHKAHMWPLKWLPLVAHMWATGFLQRWPMSGPHVPRCVAHMWPTCGRQEAPMWQTTGPHVGINRYINGNQEANAWHSTGTEVAHLWQLFRPTTGPRVATNRFRNGNQEAHTWH